MKEIFTNKQLRTIIDQAVTYKCACPAQVAELILKVREVYRYETRCLEEENNVPETHRLIAKTVEQAHNRYEDCLDRVLEIEQWDRDTLQMPEGLRHKAQLDPE